MAPKKIVKGKGGAPKTGASSKGNSAPAPDVNPSGQKFAQTGKWSDDKIEKMLSREVAGKMRVNDALSELMHPFTALLLLDASDYSEMRNLVVEKFQSGHSIIYIGLNAGYGAVAKEFERRGSSFSEVFFVDMVSIESGAKTQDSENVVYLSSPLDLTECVIAVEKRLALAGDSKAVVMVDSVSTLLIYNAPLAVEKFIHALLGKVNAYNGSAIVFSSGTGEKDSVTGTIGQFFDKIIRI